MSKNLTSKPKPKFFFCPYCNRKTISPANIKKGITMCAMCASFERQRFLYYVYDKLFFNTDKTVKLLHFAPEKSVYDKICKNQNIEYVCCDLEPKNFPFVKNIQKEDGMNLSFPDNTFDFIIHNHIMEHVPDDIKFIKECLRVLKPDGKMIVSVPYSPEGLCDDSKVTDEERIKYYGQADHVRMYGRDILAHFDAKEFEIKVINPKDYLTEEQLKDIAGIASEPEDYFFTISHKRAETLAAVESNPAKSV